MTTPLRRAGLLGALLLALLGALLLGTRTTQAAPNVAACPTFHVLHDDRIGKLVLPEGYYAIAPTKLSCGAASSLFTTFLDDWDGKLPRPWRTTIQGRGKGTFIGGRGQRFSVTFTGTKPGGGGGGQHPASGLVCRSPFTLRQTDRIGPLKLRKGRYLIDRLGPLSPNCTQSAILLGQFLQDFDGKLPGGWILLPDDATFVRGSVSYGFRLEPDPSGGGGGGGSFPTRTTRCGATFTVVHNDHVGRLQLPRGPYWVSILKDSNITCPQSSQLFARFLASPSGVLPRPWVVNAATGTFQRGRGSKFGFSVKPAFHVR